MAEAMGVKEAEAEVPPPISSKPNGEVPSVSSVPSKPRDATPSSLIKDPLHDHSANGTTVPALIDNKVAGGTTSLGHPSPPAIDTSNLKPRPKPMREIDPLESVSPLEFSPPAKSTPAAESTPPGSRSVQFASSTMEPGEHRVHSRQNSGTFDAEGDTPTKESRALAFISKLKALAAPTSPPTHHARSQSAHTIGSDPMDHEHMSPGSERSEPGYSAALERDRLGGDTDAEADADAEESANEALPRPAQARKRRKSSMRQTEGSAQTAPASPKTPVERSARFESFISPATSFRPTFPSRRATMTDIPEDRRAGVSEDEGRARLRRESTWRRGSSWVQNKAQPSPDGRRPSNLRRFTGLVGSSENPDGSPPVAGSAAQWRQRAERTSTSSAHRWRALKAGLKMMGQKRKEENKVDHAKSAELLAELTAATPAALIMASMFQRDDKGHKRIPVLLEQLKVQLTDSKRVDNKQLGDRHQIFRLELEYGSGLTRMKWVIHRALRDFTNLHLRYKLQASGDKYKQLYGHDELPKPKLPRFPRTAFPYLRGARGMGSDEEDEGDETVAEDDTGVSAAEGTASGTDRPIRKRRRRPSFTRSKHSSRAAGVQAGDVSSTVSGAAQNSGAASIGGGPGRREPYAERQRKKLEVYLQQMIRHLIFRPDSNRLCKFLELSALGVRLAAEGSYHGKEGSMVIQSSKGLDFRRGWNPNLVKKRHSPKWFLVRHSYIVCVDSPEEMNIYDVLLVDPDFLLRSKKSRLRDKKPKDLAISAKNTAAHPQHHVLRLHNSERKMKLLAKNERQLHQFEESIQFMASNTIWAKQHRFESFAPIRTGVYAQWLVDGRDYMWNVSRAISMARDVIYIHDWWLSPELYMRRPAAISQKWRLDRLLRRKASEGVKVFVIVYRNINSAIPIDSSYTKFSLLDLHSNVFVQRSPNQFRQNTFFWAHHEKLCIVDHTVAFIGGIDLCYGRWDTPQHPVTDDKLTGFEDGSTQPKDADHCQLWAGKDYSNPRVQDFYALDKPYEEMYDRSVVPRMPWHDVAMQVVGQPARDLTRHFVQRWNFILRQRSPTRPTPFLLPPPDFNPADLEALGLNGTCEVQMLRSCCWWSMGTPNKTEHSIMNGYIKTIEQSDHFIYIENQFFVTSCEVEGTRIENTIGDALVERIVRAHRRGEDWRAVVVIPLMPGFQNTVDSQDGTSVRLIMQCQYRSICRGDTSIFGRLRAHNIEPEDYIQFYGLRQWGKLGPKKTLVTEQLYIHAKTMIVDDRIAIIGSANINERSMLGTRDSETAAVVRDTDLIWSTMNGEPYQVGRFPHTLRMRLMREHLGLDVDEIMEQERSDDVTSHDAAAREEDMHRWYEEDNSATDRETEKRLLQSQHQLQDEIIAKSQDMHSFNHDADREQENNPNTKSTRKPTEDKRVTNNSDHRADVRGEGEDVMAAAEKAGHVIGRDTIVDDHHREVLVTSRYREVGSIKPKIVVSRNPSDEAASPASPTPNRTSSRASREESTAARKTPPLPPVLSRKTTAELGLPTVSSLPALPAVDDTDIGGPSLHRPFAPADRNSPLLADLQKRPTIDKDCMKDPLCDAFYLDRWQTVAENNTKIYRQVFRCMPDNEVKTWKEYKEYTAYTERFMQAQGGGGKSGMRMQQERSGKSGPPGQNTIVEKVAALGPIGEGEIKKLGVPTSTKESTEKEREKGVPEMGKVEDWAADASREADGRHAAAAEKDNQQPKTLSNEANEKDVGREPLPPLLASTTTATTGTGPEAGTGEGEKSSALKLAPSTTDTPTLATTTTTTSAVAGAAAPAPAPAPPTSNSTPPPATAAAPAAAQTATAQQSSSQRRRRRTGTRSAKREFNASDDLLDIAEAEDLLKMVQGHLVVWPHEWLAKEEQGGNWLYSIDQLAPLEIYN